MTTKLTAFVCIVSLCFISCSKEVKAPTATADKLVLGSYVEQVLSTASQGVERNRYYVRDFTYTTQESCTNQYVQMTGTETVTVSYNPNTRLTKVNLFLKATGTLQDGETFNIHGMQLMEIPTGGTVTFRQVDHFQTNHHVGNLNWNVTGHMIGPNEYQEDFVHLSITCD